MKSPLWLAGIIHDWWFTPVGNYVSLSQLWRPTLLMKPHQTHLVLNKWHMTHSETIKGTDQLTLQKSVEFQLTDRGTDRPSHQVPNPRIPALYCIYIYIIINQDDGKRVALACLWPATTTDDKRSMAWFTWRHPKSQVPWKMGGGPASHVWLPKANTLQTCSNDWHANGPNDIQDATWSTTTTYQGKMDRKHQETMQNGFCSWT